MAAEGQAQSQGVAPPRRRRGSPAPDTAGVAKAPESPDADHVLDTTATGLVSSDDDEGRAS